MKFLFDLFPVILFFAAFKLYDVFIATGVVIAATCLQIAWVWFRHGKVDKMLWVSLGLVGIFGGATLLFHDETFIKWKPTVLYWVFALTLFISARFYRRNLIRNMLEEQVKLPEPLWQSLNWGWIGFFVIMGMINILVAFFNPWCASPEQCLDQWVKFKLFGGMGLMITFVLGQGVFLAKYIPEENQ